MKFEELTINKKLIEKTHEEGYEELTLIQEKCLPAIIKGNDVVGQAETGSGKTVAFCLPILDKITPRNGIQALVLTPTRELCVQVMDVFKDFGAQLKIKTMSVYGGVSISNQIKNLPSADIVCGTPGRILDHLSRGTIDFSTVKFLVLDEMDKMFDMGFIKDVEKIISYVPRERQTLMFSATISYEVHRIMNRHLKNPVIVKTRSQVDTTKLKQVYYDIYQQNNKFPLLFHLLKHSTPGLAIVFCGTRTESDIVAMNLKRQGINALAIHGGMSQHSRSKSLDALKNETTDVLVATDVAARGLDIKNVTHVYNYDVPPTPKEYTHRIGRTARAGENGDAVTLLTERDHDNFRRVQSNEELNIIKAQMPHFEKVSFIRKSRPQKRQFKKQRHYYHRR
ncbi:MAG: DEAD/DEAH box helicase [Candidatus Thermoplasmatota archaeon]|nr:DEAD/DEAH box helicase [Candidatus Thermoplasmatota archaeon]